MNKGTKRKISWESIALATVLLCIGIVVFYLLFLSDAIGVRVVAQIQSTSTYIQKMDSVLNVTESTKNAILETLVKRDEENRALKDTTIQAQMKLKKIGNELELLQIKLKKKDSEIDSLEANINLLNNKLRRSTIEQQYNKE